MSFQFLPSSPLREGDKDQDPFSIRKKDDRGRVRFTQVPTPNPSSSIARSSSPHYEPEEPPKLTFEVDKPVMKDIFGEEVKISRVPLEKPQVIIGRSSQSDVTIKDKLVSRNHIKIVQQANYLVIECLGHNGFGITIPHTCTATQLDENSYQLHEITTPLSMNDLKKINGELAHTSIKLGYNYTEFLVRNHEKLKLPKFNNVIIEIKNNLILLNPRFNDETDEEMPVPALAPALAPPVELASELAPPVSRAPVNEAPISDLTPVRSESLLPQTPIKNSFKITSEESTPLKKFNKSGSVLADKTNTAHKLKRAKSEEPPVKKRKEVHSQLQEVSNETNLLIARSKTSTPEPEVSLEDIENLQEISNILVNHLAFSRLSSTPMSILRGISANINELSNGQLKKILQTTKPIGIISRQGKDAAGKPLEEEYYYIPEQDDDSERPNLVSSIKGHGGIRSCRRVHKQYFWRKPAPIKKEKK